MNPALPKRIIANSIRKSGSSLAKLKSKLLLKGKEGRGEGHRRNTGKVEIFEI